jgi:hypothetical protein
MVDGAEFYIDNTGYITEKSGDAVRWFLDYKWLNKEVEKIEEDKEIEKLSYQQVGYQNCDGSERKIKEEVTDFNKQVRQLGNKLNEVIEAVNELKKGK